jgi:hypothetical protein
MNAFTFPQPGERTNAATIPVAEHTLAALYALALVGQEHLSTRDRDFISPQCAEALDVVGIALSIDTFKAAQQACLEMIDELEAEYPF